MPFLTEVPEPARPDRQCDPRSSAIHIRRSHSVCVAARKLLDSKQRRSKCIESDGPSFIAAAADVASEDALRRSVGRVGMDPTAHAVVTRLADLFVHSHILFLMHLHSPFIY